MMINKLFVGAVFLMAASLSGQSAVYPNSGTLFDDKLHELRLVMSADSFYHMQQSDQLWTNHRYLVAVVYDGDTLKQCDIRLKGNTSRGSKRKSFRIDFDKRVDGQTLQGLETIYIHGSHNDPSMMREYLSAYVMKKMEVPSVRVNHVKLYLNDSYLGVRGLVEYIDKDFLKTRFGSSKGNNYKCTWPADLSWLGSDQAEYKKLINPSPENERAYDLKTNETLDDYSDIVELADWVNNKAKQQDFTTEFPKIFDVDGYLKALAAEVLIGHWDNYFYNKNNYFIYHHPTTGKMVYMPYDMDNTFGVQWGVDNINKRDIHQWGNTSKSKAPLTYALLAHDEFRLIYERYMYQAIQSFFNLDHMGPVIDALMFRLDAAVKDDLHFAGKVDTDYGYTYNDWQKTDDIAWGNHVTYGIKPYIEDRMNSALLQMDFKHSVNGLSPNFVRLFPNPVGQGETVYLNHLDGVIQGDKIIIYNSLGVKVRELELNGSGFEIEGLAEGIYWIQIGSRGVGKIQIRLN
jgi:spore coat protein CotH